MSTNMKKERITPVTQTLMNIQGIFSFNVTSIVRILKFEESDGKTRGYLKVTAEIEQ